MSPEPQPDHQSDTSINTHQGGSSYVARIWTGSTICLRPSEPFFLHCRIPERFHLRYGLLNSSTCVMASWTVQPTLWPPERFYLRYYLLNCSTYVMASLTVPLALWPPERFFICYGFLNGSSYVMASWTVPPALWPPERFHLLYGLLSGTSYVMPSWTVQPTWPASWRVSSTLSASCVLPTSPSSYSSPYVADPQGSAFLPVSLAPSIQELPLRSPALLLSSTRAFHLRPPPLPLASPRALHLKLLARF